MKILFFIFTISTICSPTLAQLSLVKNQECGENEAFETCGTACEPSCDTPSPSFCTLQCVVGCQCERGYFRNSDKKCVTSDQCTISGTTVPSNVTCGKNEIFSACHSPCTEKKCPVANPVQTACVLMCFGGCGCAENFVRNTQGECVLESQCPEIETSNSTENPCNTVDCRSGYKCENQNGTAQCVEDPNLAILPEENPGTISCANVRCGTPGGCAMVLPAGRSRKLQPQCVQENPCRNHTCGRHQECVLQQVTCIGAPCNPIPTCRSRIVPIQKRQTEPETGPSCMTARCATPAGCAMIRPSYCTQNDKSPECRLRPGCIHYNACAATTCPKGKQCVLQEVTCIMAPCNPTASCE